MAEINTKAKTVNQKIGMLRPYGKTTRRNDEAFPAVAPPTPTHE